MFCSTIIPTIGRPTLKRAVESILNQDLHGANHEVIVVNDSGRPLPEEGWQKSNQVQVIHTNLRNRSVARNAGAAIATGQFLHFLDDDDWMMPGALKNLYDVATMSQAAWSYGAFRLISSAGKLIAEIYPREEGNCFLQMLFWEWLPLQASLISAEAFFTVGGFAHLPSLLGGFEDIDISREISRYYDMAYTPKVVACIRFGEKGSTTDYINMFQQNRQSREKAFEKPGTFSRLRASANASHTSVNYWHGRIVYAYLASVKWNLKQKRLFIAMSRAAYAAAALTLSSNHIFSVHFWHGLLKPHIPRQGKLMSVHSQELFSNTLQKLKR
jgi:glycosyltransferase involved in cell wall biosynthesis